MKAPIFVQAKPETPSEIVSRIKATSRRFLLLTPSVEDVMLPSNHY